MIQLIGQTLLDATPVLAGIIIGWAVLEGMYKLIKYIMTPPVMQVDTRVYYYKRLLSSLE